MIKEQMENIYQTIPSDKIPWNIETPPEILKQIVSTKKVKPCKSIELGCGTGNYVFTCIIHISQRRSDAKV